MVGVLGVGKPGTTEGDLNPAQRRLMEAFYFSLRERIAFHQQESEEEEEDEDDEEWEEDEEEWDEDEEDEDEDDDWEDDDDGGEGEGKDE